MVQDGLSRTDDDVANRRRTEIFAAAEGLLAVHGFDALRLRDVAQEAGVSIGMIQHYFGTRDELLHETMRVASTRRVEEWSGLADRDRTAGDQLTALLEGAVGSRHRCTVWLEMCAAATRHEDLQADVRRTQDAWRSALLAVIEQGAATGEFRPRGSMAGIVDMLMRLIDGSMLALATGTEGSCWSPARILTESVADLLGVGPDWRRGPRSTGAPPA